MMCANRTTALSKSTAPSRSLPRWNRSPRHRKRPLGQPVLSRHEVPRRIQADVATVVGSSSSSKDSDSDEGFDGNMSGTLESREHGCVLLKYWLLEPSLPPCKRLEVQQRNHPVFRTRLTHRACRCGHCEGPVHATAKVAPPDLCGVHLDRPGLHPDRARPNTLEEHTGTAQARRATLTRRRAADRGICRDGVHHPGVYLHVFTPS
jgi:hypothetical protein